MHIRNKILIAVLCLCLSPAGQSASDTFQQDSFLRHVKYLASDDLQGRGNGTPELNRAAEYIAKEFESYGLLPGGEDGSYFQSFALNVGNKLGPGNKLTFWIGHESFQAALFDKFVPVGVGEKAVIDGGLVFAGYGITAEEYGYDDYKDLDVTDKVVLVLAHEPGENDPHSPFNGLEPTLHGHDNSKTANAKFHGARAVLIVQDPANHDDPAQDLPDPRLARQVDDLGICALRITRDVAQRLLGAEQKDLLGLQRQIDAKTAPQSLVLRDAQAHIELDVRRIRREVRNVVALLPGSDPMIGDETIILGAHYDHLGHGGRSSMSPQLIGQIHNGADDNASGTAGLLELASAFARNRAAYRRSFLFIAFAGEELGLRGSSYWTDHPTRPLQKAVAMLNMDMIGRNSSSQVVIGGIGTSPMLPELVQSAAEEAGIQVTTTKSGYGSSDHMSFYLKNVPVLFFFSGLHADYHRPSDDWEKISAPGAAKILGMVHSIATRLNALGSRPQFTKVDDLEPGNLRGGGAAGYGSYFGSVPDMTDESKGVRFADIRPNSPAAKAGLRGQDILVRFAGKNIENLQDFTYVLRTHKPGETVEVVVLRDGQPLTVQVTLGVRR